MRPGQAGRFLPAPRLEGDLRQAAPPVAGPQAHVLDGPCDGHPAGPRRVSMKARWLGLGLRGGPNRRWRCRQRSHPMVEVTPVPRQ